MELSGRTGCSKRGTALAARRGPTSQRYCCDESSRRRELTPGKPATRVRCAANTFAPIYFLLGTSGQYMHVLTDTAICSHSKNFLTFSLKSGRTQTRHCDARPILSSNYHRPSRVSISSQTGAALLVTSWRFAAEYVTIVCLTVISYPGSGAARLQTCRCPRLTASLVASVGAIQVELGLGRACSCSFLALVPPFEEVVSPSRIRFSFGRDHKVVRLHPRRS